MIPNPNIVARVSVLHTNRTPEVVRCAVAHIYSQKVTGGSTNSHAQSGVGLEVGVGRPLDAVEQQGVRITTEVEAREEGERREPRGYQTGCEVLTGTLQRIHDRLPNPARADDGAAQHDANLELFCWTNVLLSGHGPLPGHVERVAGTDSESVAESHG